MSVVLDLAPMDASIRSLVAATNVVAFDKVKPFINVALEIGKNLGRTEFKILSPVAGRADKYTIVAEPTEAFADAMSAFARHLNDAGEDVQIVTVRHWPVLSFRAVNESEAA